MTQGGGIATMLAYDGANSSITHPAADAGPGCAGGRLAGDGTRTNNTTPQLSASYFESDGNYGNAVVPALLPMPRCATVLQGPSSTSDARERGERKLDAEQPRRRHVLLAGDGDRYVGQRLRHDDEQLRRRHRAAGRAHARLARRRRARQQHAARRDVRRLRRERQRHRQLPALHERVVLVGRRIRHVRRRHAESGRRLQPGQLPRRHLLLASPRDRRRR